MIPLESGVDPLAFESWVQIAALLIIVSGGITFKWLGTISSKAKDTSDVVDEIKKTLTTTNGGSHIKDQLNRIEEIQHKQAEMMAADSQKLLDHIDWSTTYAQETKAMLDQLPCQQKVGLHYLDESNQS